MRRERVRLEDIEVRYQLPLMGVHCKLIYIYCTHAWDVAPSTDGDGEDRYLRYEK